MKEIRLKNGPVLFEWKYYFLRFPVYFFPWNMLKNMENQQRSSSLVNDKIRDYRHITSIMLNRFCEISNPFPSPPIALSPHVLNRQYPAWQNTKQNEMQNTYLFSIASQVLKVLLMKSYMIQPVFLFLVVSRWFLYASSIMTFYKFL